MKIHWKLFLFALLLILPDAVAAAAPVVLDESQGKFPLGMHLDILEDKEGDLDLSAVMKPEHESHFFPSTSKVPNFGFTKSAYWVKFTLVNPLDQEQHVLLEDAYPHIDDIQLYVFRDGEQVAFTQGGDGCPFRNYEIDYSNFTVRLMVPPQSKTYIFMRFQTESSMQIPLTIWRPVAFAEKINKEQAILGLYFGIMGAMLLYNLFLFIFLKDTNYLYYILYITFFMLAQLGVNRLDIEYLWPNHPVWANLSHPIFFNLTFFFGGLFCRSFLNTKENARYIDKAILLMMGVCLLGVLLTFVSGYTAGIKCVVYFIAIFGPIFLLAAGIKCWIKGLTAARYYTIAWTVFLIGAIVFNFRNIGVLPSIPIIDFSPHIGSSIEVIFLSLALGDRINAIKNETIAAKERAFVAEKVLTTELEKLVAERTAKLQEANRELQKQSNTDGLTKIFNRRYFDQQLITQWKHYSRKSQPMALIICDIDFFKQYNDTYGHQAGDECLIAVARVLEESASRPHDVAARYGGEEFVILLPDTGAQGALAVAQKVKNTIKNLNITHRTSTGSGVITLSYGIASLIPDGNADSLMLISLADNALYQSKENGRDRITVYSG